MTWHPTDDDLVLRFYGEQPPEDAARLDLHLRACSSCQDAWAELSETLRLVDNATVPEPPDGFERVMWAKVQQALPAPRRSLWTWRQLVPAASLAAVVIAVVALTFRSRPAAPAQSAPERPAMAKAATGSTDSTQSERVLLTALDDHFEQTQLLLTELLNAPDGGGEFAYERTTADDLVASGRLYRITAEQIGKKHLAAMLDELEPVLTEVARSSERVNRNDLKSLRSQIDGESLLFKVRAVSNEIRERQQEIITTHEGSL
jgi:hypothetical protein